MATYDPKYVTASFKGVILGDFAADTFIKVTRDGDDFEQKQGAAGYDEFTNKNINMHIIEFTCMQTSSINAALSAILAQDRIDNLGEGAFLLKDVGPNGTTLVSISSARITKPAEADMGGSTKERTWTLRGGKAGDYVIGGNS